VPFLYLKSGLLDLRDLLELPDLQVDLGDLPGLLEFKVAWDLLGLKVFLDLKGFLGFLDLLVQLDLLEFKVSKVSKAFLAFKVLLDPLE